MYILILMSILTILLLYFSIHCYNFFNIYIKFDNYDKIEYLSNNILMKNICKINKTKKLIGAKILSSLIKINYFLASTFYVLLCVLYKKELNIELSLNDNVSIKNNILTNENDTQNTNEMCMESLKKNVLRDIVNNMHTYDDNMIVTNKNDDGNEEGKDNKEDIHEYLLDINVQKNDTEETKIISLDEEHNKNKMSVEDNEENKDIIETTINNEDNIEVIALEEIDFGDYMSKLIKELPEKGNDDLTNSKLESNKNTTNEKIPAKIKIGKKKN